MFHEQYTSQDRPVYFRCKECGYRSQSLGGLHAHIEGHRGFTRFNIQIPFTDTAIADGDKLMELTEVHRVTETERIKLSEVDGL